MFRRLLRNDFRSDCSHSPRPPFRRASSQLFALAVTMSVLSPVSALGATTIYVDDVSCPGTGTESDPFCRIQAAITAAVHGDEIVVAPGIYHERINFFGKAISLRSSDGPGVTIIDGASLNDSVVKCTSQEGADTILDGFTVTGGTGDPNVFFHSRDGGFGGGMLILDSSPTVRNCVFTENSAKDGGGMLNAEGSQPTVSNCTFSRNVAERDGGGVLNGSSDARFVACLFIENQARSGGAIRNFVSNPSIVECTFVQNTASVFGGGMINIASSPSVIQCVFLGNIALDSGGAIAKFFASSPHVAGNTIDGCTFTGNTATTGAGILFFRVSQPINNCLFLENVAEHFGGGIRYADVGGVVSNSRFVMNTAGSDGGGISNSQSTPSLDNCLFRGNTARFGGGVSNFRGSPWLTNCTFTENTALELGGGMAIKGNRDPIVTNCIFWGDSPDEIAITPSSTGLSIPTISYSDVQGGLPIGAIDAGGNIDADPLFTVALAGADPLFSRDDEDDEGHDDDDGEDEDEDEDDDDPMIRVGALRLSAGSPAIDAGDNTSVPDDVTTDLDGNARFQDDTNTVDTGIGPAPIVDMGAYEFRGELAATLDIMPGKCPNEVKLHGHDRIKVAIAGTNAFDPSRVDVDSIVLVREDGVGISVRPLAGRSGARFKIKDVTSPRRAEQCACSELHRDGIDDLEIGFGKADVFAAFELRSDNPGESIVLTLHGLMFDGTAFELSDCIVIKGAGNHRSLSASHSRSTHRR